MIRALFLASALLAAPVASAQTKPATPAITLGPVDPARLAAAQRTIALLVPQGIYARMTRDQWPRMLEASLAGMKGLSAADLGGSGAGSPLDALRAKDPDFDERLDIMVRVMGEELTPILTQLEPELRAGLARAFARRFTVAQLADINAFFATPSGTVMAENFLSLFADPDVMLEMSRSAPLLAKAMPGIIAKVEAATAHLPPKPDYESAK
ncbi:DUF2059 domain-containing protein [Sphingomonas sp. PL-96]|uniref:DUF2059 domain-containing protein n=1 Tax=Sphingomonas sp. PL-96 TaxID=2887201 RepID=UPI001E344204|nr:DUF2059 domain-containing protein [Sphingomonas sp. PL-96]MCC2978072.1 DUF2059 domain-containing protein [Sphingomonas sp. PL-96]